MKKTISQTMHGNRSLYISVLTLSMYAVSNPTDGVYAESIVLPSIGRIQTKVASSSRELQSTETTTPELKKNLWDIALYLNSSNEIPSTTEQIQKNKINDTDKDVDIVTTLGLLLNQLLSPKSNITESLIIREITSETTNTEATIRWNASDLAIGRIYYDTTRPIVVGSTTSWVNASEYGNYANSKAFIRHLTPNTTYYFKIALRGPGGGATISKENIFTTK